jgi:hypothetical protein
MSTSPSEWHIQITVDPVASPPNPYCRLLPGPYQGKHDYTVWREPDTKLVIHLYWCPALPSDQVHQRLLPKVEQFIQRTIHMQTPLKTLENPAQQPKRGFQEIFNTLTRSTYVYRNGEWVPEATSRKPLTMRLSNWP